MADSKAPVPPAAPPSLEEYAAALRGAYPDPLTKTDWASVLLQLVTVGVGIYLTATGNPAVGGTVILGGLAGGAKGNLIADLYQRTVGKGQ